jgi:hypothetical protein
MKKTSCVVAILASALLAGACHKKPAATTPTGGDKGSAMGSGDMGSGGGGSGDGSAMGSGGGT